MLDYEGAQEIERAWHEGLTPDPLLSVSTWADQHRMLSSKASAEPGRWRTARTPYLREIMDCLSPASLMALYLTNWRESIDFIESNVGVVPACIIIAGLGLFLYACWRGHMTFARRLEQEDSTAGRMGALALLVIGSLISLFWYVPQTSIAGLWNDVDTYVKQTQTYSLNYEERFASIAVEGTQTLMLSSAQSCRKRSRRAEECSGPWPS